MKKTDLVTEIADAADLSKADAPRLDAFISVVTKALKAGDSVT